MVMTSRLHLLALAILIVALGLVSCKKQPADQNPPAASAPAAASAAAPSASASGVDEAQSFKLIAVNVISSDSGLKRKYLDLFHENVKKQFNNGLPGETPSNGARCTNCDKTPPEDELLYMVLDDATVLAKFDAALGETQQAAGTVQLAMNSTSRGSPPTDSCSSAKCPTSTPSCTCISYPPSPSGCRVRAVGPPYKWCDKPS